MARQELESVNLSVTVQYPFQNQQKDEHMVTHASSCGKIFYELSI
jgi:hypothetical protein